MNDARSDTTASDGRDDRREDAAPAGAGVPGAGGATGGPDADRGDAGPVHGDAAGGSTRAALLAAGRSLFARRGYDGASVRAITTRAGANLGAVTYHFGSKRALYEEVLRTAVEPLRDRVLRVAGPAPAEGRARTGARPALDRVGDIVRGFFRHLSENPDIPQLMLQEIAAGKDPPPPVLRTLPTILSTLAGVISEGQADGRIRDGDPRLLALSCIAQPLHLTLVKRWARRMADVRLDEPRELERIVEHAVTFAVAGLEARGGPRRDHNGSE